MKFPIESFQKVATPFYAYDIALLKATLENINKILLEHPKYHVHYALKANNNTIICKLIAEYGFGADCVSGAEVEHALKCGFRKEDIFYAGVGKTDDEINKCLDLGIGCFNVESVPELININELATKKGVSANVALRINPNIDAGTHPNITTGTYEDQFGIQIDNIDEVINKTILLKNIVLKGLHFHIGSQILNMQPFAKLCLIINSLQQKWKERGIKFDWINVGGGLGIDYEHPDKNPIADFKQYFNTFNKIDLEDFQHLHFELGRAIVAQCGSLITKVLYIKEGVNKKFAIVDAGFNDLIRPALYDSYHSIERLLPPTDVSHTDKEEKYDIVGPICESTDCFARGRILPALKRNDLLVIRSAGAYGESMASTYNMRALPSSFYFDN